MSKLYINNFGDRMWFDERGLRHREDGAAVEYSDGSKLFYWRGIPYLSHLKYLRKAGAYVKNGQEKKEEES